MTFCPLGILTTPHSLMSSANMLSVLTVLLMMTLNSTGPHTDPWEAPFITALHLNLELLTSSLQIQPSSYFLIHKTVHPSNSNLSSLERRWSYSRPNRCQTVCPLSSEVVTPSRKVTELCRKVKSCWWSHALVKSCWLLCLPIHVYIPQVVSDLMVWGTLLPHTLPWTPFIQEVWEERLQWRQNVVEYLSLLLACCYHLANHVHQGGYTFRLTYLQKPFHFFFMFLAESSNSCTLAFSPYYSKGDILLIFSRYLSLYSLLTFFFPLVWPVGLNSAMLVSSFLHLGNGSYTLWKASSKIC